MTTSLCFNGADDSAGTAAHLLNHKTNNNGYRFSIQNQARFERFTTMASRQDAEIGFAVKSGLATKTPVHQETSLKVIDRLAAATAVTVSSAAQKCSSSSHASAPD